MAAKIVVSILVSVVLLIGLSTVSSAELIDNGDGTVTQIRNDGSMLMWLKDAVNGNYDYWDDAKDWVLNLNYAGYDDWRLPDGLKQDGTQCSNRDCYGTASEMGYLFDTELGGEPWFINCTNGVDCGLINGGGPFTGLASNSRSYWTGTGFSIYTEDGPVYYALHFSFRSGYYYYQDLEYVGGSYSAWAVRDVSPPTVPEPISSILFITGGTLLTGRRFIRKSGHN